MSPAPEVPGPPGWAAHLPPELADEPLDLLARRSLPAAWAAVWAAEPAREVLLDPQRGWLHAAELDARSQLVAGRLAGAGLVPGDRVLVSAAPSADLVI